MSDLDRLDEEFNNFMLRVNEVDGILKKLASKDKTLQDVGTLEAENYLKENKSLEHINENSVELVIKTNRSVINKKALEPEKDQATMSQEAFMREVERDAEARYKDKMIRKEKSDTFKTQAVKAFKRGEYERALCCYNKAIELIRDSSQLYLDRCLTEINLNIFDKAIDDAKTALKFNENSLRAWLLLAKAHFKNDDLEECEKAVKEAKQRNEEHKELVEEYVAGFKNEQHT